MFKYSKDILGTAMMDYYYGDKTVEIVLHNYIRTRKLNTSIGYNILPLRDLCKEINELEIFDKMAIDKCRGKVLDIGAGSGSHSLALVENKCDVISLDISKGATEVMKKRGLKKIEQIDINHYKEKSFDTLVFFGNNHGMFGNMRKFTNFIKKSYKTGLLNKNGQIIISSPFVDLPFLNNFNKCKCEILLIKIQLEYKGQKSKKFKWMMVSPAFLNRCMKLEGFRTEEYFSDNKSSCVLKISKPYI